MDKRADMIPVEWIEKWGKNSFSVYAESAIAKMLEAWKVESSCFPIEEKPSYIFADDLAKVGNRTVNQKEGSN